MKNDVEKSRKIVIVTGSNRTGTSLMVELLVGKGFHPPEGEMVNSREYNVYECTEFKNISRDWSWQKAKEFVNSIEGEKVVLKYPKSSKVISKWMSLLPNAKIIYVFRPRGEAVNSQIINWWKDRPFAFIARLIYNYEWIRGYLAVSNLKVPVHFVTFEELRYTKNFNFPKCWEWEE